MVAGKKLAVVPLGTPLTDRLTDELNPLIPDTVMGLGAAPAGATLSNGWPTASVKLGGRIVRPIV